MHTSDDNTVSSDAARPVEMPGGAPPVVVFFDLDGTLVMGQTQWLLVKYMHKAGAVGWAFMVGVMIWFAAYKLRLVRLTQRARELGAAMFKGLTVEEVQESMTKFVKDVLEPRLHHAVVEALERHRAEGHLVVILSAALEPVVEALSARLVAHGYAGTECEVAHGRYTGRLDGAIPHANEKIRVAASFIARWKSSAAECWAYADHESDRELLHWVGHPVAVRPRPALLATAQKAGWPVIP